MSGRDVSDAPVVGLAHQRVIEAWARARDVIAQSADLLRVRQEVEEACRRWDTAGQRNDLLIRPGLALSEAEHAAAALGDELPPALRAFVEKSTRAARLRQRLTAIAAGIFLALAIGAGALGLIARQQQTRAEQAAGEAQEQTRRADAARVVADEQRQSADTARAAADEQRRNADTARAAAEEQRRHAEELQKFAIAEATRNEEARKLAEAKRREAELRLAAADELMDPGKADLLRQCLAASQRAGNHPAPRVTRAYFVGRWHVDQGFGSTDIDWKEDGTCESKSVFNNDVHAMDLKNDVCTWSFEALPDNEFVVTYKSARLGDNFPKRLRFKPVSPTRIHNPELNYDATRILCPAQELTLVRADLAELTARADKEPGNMALRRDAADGMDRVGEALAGQGDLAAALDQFQQSLKLRLAVARGDEENKVWQRDISNTLQWLGIVRAGLKQNDVALDSLRSSLAIRQNLSSASPTDAVAKRDLAIAHERVGDMLKLIGDRRDEALQELRIALKLRSDLALADQNNTMLTTELIVALYKVSTVSDPAAAKDLLGKALILAEIMERQHRLAPDYANWPALLKAEIAKLK